MPFRKSWSAWWGIELSAVSAKEKLVSMLGGFIGIAVLVFVAERCCGLPQVSALITSMGASAVLLYGVPHGQLSQPWPVLAGHGLAAFIGVCCAKWIPQPELAGACAVALAIGAMHQFKCIHPPGGATALTAVLGGPAIHELGFKFVVLPVLMNAMLMVLIAVIYNAAFSWRRYPAALNAAPAPAPARASLPSHEEITAAIRSLDSFVDITEDDLLKLLEILSSSAAVHGGAPNRVMPAAHERPCAG